MSSGTSDLGPGSSGLRSRRRSRTSQVHRSQESRKLTPYSSRNETSTVKKLRDLQTERAVTKFVNKTCRVYRVSPLWHFDPRSRKEYSQQLNGLLKAIPPTTKQSSQSTPQDYECDVAVFGGGVLITIALGQGTVPLSAVLLCRNIEPHKIEKGFSYYPLMLVQGVSSVSQVVTDWIRTSFDCCVTAPQLRAELLHSLAAKYATIQKSSSRQAGKLKLLYQPPEAVQKAGLDVISLELPYDSIMALSKDDLYTALEEMIQKEFHLKLSSLQLAHIITPVLLLDTSGVMKCQMADHMITVLASIQEDWNI